MDCRHHHQALVSSIGSCPDANGWIVGGGAVLPGSGRVGRPRREKDAEPGDALLDAFNEASTGGNVDEAHRIADVIEKAPRSPRMKFQQ